MSKPISKREFLETANEFIGNVIEHLENNNAVMAYKDARTLQSWIVAYARNEETF